MEQIKTNLVDTLTDLFGINYSGDYTSNLRSLTYKQEPIFKKEKDNIIISFIAVGYSEKDIEFKYDTKNNVIIIEGEPKGDKFYQESFKYKFSIPENLKVKNVKKEFDNGIVTLTLETKEKEEKNSIVIL